MSTPENKPAEKNPGPSSSFPISSPSFWAEAATISIPTVDHKRSRFSPVEGDTGETSSGEQDHSPLPKRPRNSTRSPDHGLTFLPNPQDIDPDGPQAYLANPEYAPNRFGDIGDYMRKKEIKVQAQNASIAVSASSKTLPQIFTGLSFHINGNTQPSMEQLRKLLLQRGGTVYPVLRNKTMVDYIIAPVLTLKKHEEFKRYKVVKEGWVVESCQQDKLLDWRKWRLQPDGGGAEAGTKSLERFFAQKAKAKQDLGEAAEELSIDYKDTKLAAPVDDDTEYSAPSDTVSTFLLHYLSFIHLLMKGLDQCYAQEAHSHAGSVHFNPPEPTLRTYSYLPWPATTIPRFSSTGIFKNSKTRRGMGTLLQNGV